MYPCGILLCCVFSPISPKKVVTELYPLSHLSNLVDFSLYLVAFLISSLGITISVGATLFFTVFRFILVMLHISSRVAQKSHHFIASVVLVIRRSQKAFISLPVCRRLTAAVGYYKEPRNENAIQQQQLSTGVCDFRLRRPAITI